jgi:hypothetical protein
MNPQLKQSWVGALRSGAYRQAFGHLRVSTEFGVRHCAMGVLYDLIAPPPDPFDETAGEDWLSPFMPEARLAAAGVSQYQQRLIASLNDHGSTFEQIADIVERDMESEEDLCASVQRELKRIHDRVTERVAVISAKLSTAPITSNAYMAAKKYFTSPFITKHFFFSSPVAEANQHAAVNFALSSV